MSSASAIRFLGATLGGCALLLTQLARAADPVTASTTVPATTSTKVPATASPKGPPTASATVPVTIPVTIPVTAPVAPPVAAPVTAPATEANANAPKQRLDPVLVTLVSSNAPPALVWHGSRFGAVDWLAALAGGAITLTTAIIPPAKHHSLGGGILFDNSVRSTLRAHSLVNRYMFRDASDVGVSLMVSWPLVADSLTAAWWYRGSRDVAEQTALIDMEAFAISGAIQGVTNSLVSRERPYGPDCGSAQLPGDATDCNGSGHYRSFFSGHATNSFTGAALICMHHFENDLLGSPWDALSCAGGYAVAATTATFRVVGDMHYASDVLTGALVGTLVGYGVPLLHYSQRGAPATNTLQLHLVPAVGGVGVLGIF